MNIHFEKATLVHKDIIFAWLAEPHVGEFDVQAGAFKGSINQLMVRKLSPAVSTRLL